METIPWYKTEWFKRVVAVVLGAALALLYSRTGIQPQEPPAWLLPIIQKQDEIVKEVKEIKAVQVNSLNK